MPKKSLLVFNLNQGWGGDFCAVTDWGRATVAAASLSLLASAFITVLEHLESEKGYTVVGVKNTLNPEKNVSANGGYRNLVLLLKCPSGHVIELQFNLSPLEEVKQERGVSHEPPC